jgi:hypothetical protein
MDNGVDDDDDVESEIRRQLDALTESDLEMEENADWTTCLGDLKGLDNVLAAAANDENVDSPVRLPESMVLYLSTIKGRHDDRIESELQDCNETLEKTNEQSNLADSLMERMKKEVGDHFSEEEILASRQAIIDLEKQEEASFQLFMQTFGDGINSSGHEPAQEIDEFKGLKEFMQKQQQMEQKRRAENEKRRQEMKEAELKIERERKQKEEEWKAEQQRLEQQQRVCQKN